MVDSPRELGGDYPPYKDNKRREDALRRAIGIFQALADRKIRSSEGEALTKGFTFGEDDGTNWFCIATAAELAKGGYEAVNTPDGEIVFRRTRKG